MYLPAFIVSLLLPLYLLMSMNNVQALHLPRKGTDGGGDPGLGTPGDSVQPVACISQTTFEYYYNRTATGPLKFKSHNRKKCDIDCRATGAKFAYFLQKHSECYCGEGPAPDSVIEGADDVGTCHKKDASVDYTQSPFYFDRCYEALNTTGIKPVPFVYGFFDIEECFQYCAQDVDIYQVGTVGFTRTYTEFYDQRITQFGCQCFTGQAKGINSTACGPDSVQRYYNGFRS